MRAAGQTQRLPCRRQCWSRNHLLRTHEQSTGSVRSQHQARQQRTGRSASLRCALLVDEIRTRARVQRFEGAHDLEAQSCASAALAANHRPRYATCTQEPIGRAVSRPSYESEPRYHWLGVQSARSCRRPGEAPERSRSRPSRDRRSSPRRFINLCAKGLSD